ncbi:unnamed protein product [Microthlaspi erraticum]|uniref:Reverse transcriptase zinc-binding domain-containing protein n=1 Tax=Microthlaspi erraticum TaxID=1685480 RepID=A0A6D2HLC6_9BRAS|nr:unnamed protein product [Microthlaspi erraticum]
MAKILRDYESISGQKVNLQKSSIVFGMRIGHSRRRVIQGILGIDKVGGGGKYLGLPEQFGRSKSEAFKGIVKRVKENIGGWYNQQLSTAGKEVLIKSIAQSKPVYSMSCFLFPKQVCEEINSALSEFWWGKNDNARRKISWISWKRLSLPKNEGGMGFKDLQKFNLALLGKQAWRVLKNPNSLLSRIYKGRYHKTTTFLESTCGRNPSYGWRSLQAELAKKIRLSRWATQDKKIWAYTSNAEYTVKSGYWVATHLVSDNERINPPAGSLEVKKKIWRIKVEPKIQHFLWKAIAGALPSSERLCSKSVDIDPVCQCCNQEEETINHLLFQCQYAKAVWQSAGFNEFDTVNSTLEENISLMFQINHSTALRTEDRFLPFWVVWRIWKSRNELLFTQKQVQAMEDALKSMEEVAEWLSVNPTSETHQHIQRQGNMGIWDPPPSGWLKCNSDSSFKVNNDYMGVGWIIRDEHGHYIESGWARLENVGSILEAEGNGFLYVVQRVWHKGFRQVWFEGDNLQLVNVINKREDSYELGNLLVDIHHWISKLPLCSLDHGVREKNMAADKLSKCVYQFPCSFMLYSVPPIWLQSLLYNTL